MIPTFRSQAFLSAAALRYELCATAMMKKPQNIPVADRGKKSSVA